MSELMLIAVPRIALDDDGALLRAVVVPRLSGRGGALADYGMTDWPAVIAGARLEVRLRDGAGQDLAPVADVPVRTQASSEVWRAFFDGVGVTPFAGVAGLSPLRALVPAAAASGIWYAMIVAVGSALGLSWETVKALLQGANRWLGLVSLVLLAATLWWFWRSRRTP